MSATEGKFIGRLDVFIEPPLRVISGYLALDIPDILILGLDVASEDRGEPRTAVEVLTLARRLDHNLSLGSVTCDCAKHPVRPLRPRCFDILLGDRHC